jgi:GNAT superfamily N-acetyltransferase
VSEPLDAAPQTLVRPVKDHEIERVGELTVQSYIDGTDLSPESDYVNLLRQAADRAAASPLLVAVRDGAVVGAVSACPYGTRWSEIAEPGELELRMLVVDKAARGTGVAEALLAAVDDLGRQRGDHTLVLSVIDDNHNAHRLYAKHRFVRHPERDWDPTPEAHLLAYTRSI